nr:uncharacterized protein LOC115259459 [Aedes albopictus]XP_029715896.1 uncharacterized protein LOC115259462 [Aedes albopictus]
MRGGSFTRKDSSSIWIKIGREVIAINNTNRYFGYTVGKTLTHRKYIEEVRDKAAGKLKIIKLLGKRSSNANPNTLVNVGNAIIRSRLEYEAQIYGNTLGKDSTQAFHNRRQFSDYILERSIRENILDVQNKKENHSQQFWQLKFLEMINSYCQDFHHLYTDASKTASGTAFVVYDHTTQQLLSSKINSNYSITNAELLGIRSAMEIIKEKQYQKAVIFTDSRGACQIIRNKTKTNDNFLAWEAAKLLKEGKVKLQWVPSHQGIPGNEKADEEAMRATQTTFNSLTRIRNLGGLVKRIQNNIYRKRNLVPGYNGDPWN